MILAVELYMSLILASRIENDQQDRNDIPQRKIDGLNKFMVVVARAKGQAQCLLVHFRVPCRLGVEVDLTLSGTSQDAVNVVACGGTSKCVCFCR